MEWCPQNAMNAYLNTLHLRKIYGVNQASSNGGNNLGENSRCDHDHDHEPKMMEFLSALAAGNGAKLIVQMMNSSSSDPTTLALAVAAKQTGGRLVVCIVPYNNDDDDDNKENIMMNINGYHDHLKEMSQLGDDQLTVVVVAAGVHEIIRQLKDIDFLVVDSSSELIRRSDDDDDGYLIRSLLKTADLNPKGSVVVITNLLNNNKNGIIRRKNDPIFGEMMMKINKKYYGSILEYEFVTLPVGEEIELTKKGAAACKKYNNRRKSTRFHVTYI